MAAKVAIALPLNGWVHHQAQLLRAPWGDTVFNIYVGLLTGITEVLMVWLFLRYTRFGRARWPQVVAFGIGFGAIEALLVGVGALASVALAITIPDKFPKDALEKVAQSGHLAIQLAPISERIFACLGHLATNVMLFYAASRRAPRWFWLAFAYKSAIDAAAALYLQTSSREISLPRLWTMEGVTALWGIAGLWVTLWIARRQTNQRRRGRASRRLAGSVVEASDALWGESPPRGLNLRGDFSAGPAKRLCWIFNNFFQCRSPFRRSLLRVLPTPVSIRAPNSITDRTSERAMARFASFFQLAVLASVPAKIIAEDRDCRNFFRLTSVRDLRCCFRNRAVRPSVVATWGRCVGQAASLPFSRSHRRTPYEPRKIGFVAYLWN